MPFKHLAAIVATDQLGSVTAATRLLREAGLTDVRTARDGAEALAQAQQKLPNFLLLDLSLLHDAHQALRVIRRAESEPLQRLPVVALIAQATHSSIGSLRDGGANEILVKPLTSDKLVSRIRAMLRTPRTFIAHDAYCGPDRRRGSDGGVYAGPFRRSTDPAEDVFEVA